jgi:hypothetical protein
MTLVEWEEWKLSQTTKEWFDFLKNLREEIKEDWAQSRYVGEYDSLTCQMNAAALGQVRLIEKLLEAEYVEIEEQKVESKQ